MDLPVPFSPSITMISESVNVPFCVNSETRRKADKRDNLDVELEIAQLLVHVGVAVRGVALGTLLALDDLRHLEAQSMVAETQVLRGNETSKEDVDACALKCIRMLSAYYEIIANLHGR